MFMLPSHAVLDFCHPIRKKRFVFLPLGFIHVVEQTCFDSEAAVSAIRISRNNTR